MVREAVVRRGLVEASGSDLKPSGLRFSSLCLLSAGIDKREADNALWQLAGAAIGGLVENLKIGGVEIEDGMVVAIHSDNIDDDVARGYMERIGRSL